ncbi:MAG: hypothetical protein KGK08_06205 [Acidobacteriota bacterium]|nr:hypothetical protein [Acidobacteriota bacterium]
MATATDAELVMKLYDLRREPVMREARKFILFQFKPQNHDELYAVTRNQAVPENAYWRQVISYWEMAATLALRGAVDPELFLDWNGEGLVLYAKYHHWHAESEKQSGQPFMRNTAALIERFPEAKARYEGILSRFGPGSGR